MDNKHPAWIDITAQDAAASRAFYTRPRGPGLDPDGNRIGLWQD
jgi:predicted enzyme related to lactoylglutathione lyase